MKAAITPSYGPANIFETRDVPAPLVGAGELLIEVHASPVTAGDRRLRAADFPGFSALPGRLMMGVFAPRKMIQGSMFAGRVVETGAGVTDYKVGDDVFGSSDHGAYAEFLTMKEDGAMARMPAGVDYDEAAAVPYGAVTALHFLRDLGQVKPGERVLILGASGGVGRYAVQLAKHMGAHVTGVESRRNALARELGADEVIDYTAEDFTDNGEQYDVILDIADATTFRRSRASLTKNGRYLTLFMSLRVLLQMAMSALFDGPKAKFSIALGTRKDMEYLAALLSDGVIRPVIAARFPLERIADAHAQAETGRLRGDVLVTI